MLAFKKAYCTTDAMLGRSSSFPMEALSPFSLLKEDNRLKKNEVENVRSKTLYKIYMLTKAID